MRQTSTGLGRAALVLVAALAAGPGCSCSGTPGGMHLDLGNDLRGPDAGMHDLASDMFSGCGLVTCASEHAECGPVGDGCGGTIQCGSCPTPKTCGGGGVPFKCGGAAACVPKTCSGKCGPVGDGCGLLLNCGGCPSGQTCGGGGIPYKCGAPGMTDAGVCVPRDCTAQGLSCGPTGDGCGLTLNCGTCTTGTCGGGGVPGRCGSPPCTPRTTCPSGMNCGLIGNGCGGMLSCGGACPAGQSCGGAMVANQCGTPACTPRTTCPAGLNCGVIGNGCGTGTISCGGPCPAGQLCGVTMPNVCGTPMCTPATTCPAGLNCGVYGNGCGTGTINCGSCGSGVCCGCTAPNVCGNPTADAGVPACDGGDTTVSGIVVAPTDCARGFCDTGQTYGDPIYNATVYVPRGSIQAITTGATCEQCAVSQPALTSTTTGTDGRFRLTGVPAGANVKVVIQLGKWRRVLTLTVNSCVDNPLTTDQTRFPRQQGEFDPLDNIPRFAIDTGDVDALECVLRKMGVADSEFVNPALNGTGTPTAAGRVHVYQAQPATKGCGGAVIDVNTPGEGQMFAQQNTLNAYDAVLFPCEGGPDTEAAGDQAKITEYANKGGRVFATHYSYVWIHNNTSLGVTAPLATAGNTFESTAVWAPDSAGRNAGPKNGLIDQSFAKGVSLATWLRAVTNNLYPLGVIPVFEVRHDFNLPLSNAQRWMYMQNAAPGNGPGDFPEHYTFNTPVGAAATNQCGRVVFSDFHVENVDNGGTACNGTFNSVFPTECVGGPLTPQEKLLEFMLFDLTSCIQPDQCQTRSCASLGFSCGIQTDGCGGTQNCGTCAAPLVCGGGGTPGVCGGSCTPKTCALVCPPAPAVCCGTYSDGCGGVTANCGTCMAPQVCGGGGTPGVCGGGCVPKTCAMVCPPAPAVCCGPYGDGCGGLTPSCGSCPTGESCGGGGVPGVCGGGCTPRDCASQNIHCGPAGDGCGNLIPGGCGSCPPPQTCGGGGVPGTCGTGMCVPLTCRQQNINCGPAGDGCGMMITCPPCPAGQTCGGGGVPGVCGAPSCTPRTCSQVIGVDCTNPAVHCCGAVGDGCGGTLSCGTCTPPLSCGGGGSANQCGQIG